MPALRNVWVGVLLLALVVGSAACDVLVEEQATGLSASGVVEAVEVAVASETGGRVAEVLVDEGDTVQEGDVLFRIQDDLLAARGDEAQAAVEAAQANLDTAKAALATAETNRQVMQTGVELARIQLQLELDNARLTEQPLRQEAWSRALPNDFSLPVWYFLRDEELQAAQAEVDAARAALEDERQNFEEITRRASNVDLAAAEARLAEAQAAYLVAEALKDREVASGDRKFVDEFTQLTFDTAKAALESAQKEYDRILTEQAADDVLEARARLVVSQERYETALDRLSALRTGEHALTVQAARVAVQQAEARVEQAEAAVRQAEASVRAAERAVAQAQAAFHLVEVQFEKLEVRAAVSGVVMNRALEPGEVIQPGAPVMTIGQLDRMTVTVYIPEDRYGQINLNDHARVTSDSFPGEVFDGVVVRIANRAEYTPRNVQTQEDRRTTVFAVELAVNDPDGKLKPGMPTDVTFDA